MARELGSMPPPRDPETSVLGSPSPTQISARTPGSCRAWLTRGPRAGAARAAQVVPGDGQAI